MIKDMVMEKAMGMNMDMEMIMIMVMDMEIMEDMEGKGVIEVNIEKTVTIDNNYHLFPPYPIY